MEGYNGYTNRATWNVLLWVGNDEGLYLARQDADVGTGRDCERFVRARWPSGRTPDDDDLDEVNWFEVAEEWREE